MDIVSSSKALMLSVGSSPVMWLMIMLSVVSLTIIVERVWFFATTREDVTSLNAKLAERLDLEDLAGARALMEESRAVEASIALAGLSKAPRGAKAASEAMIGATALARLRLERRLAFLGTLGNNAPFIGLFGTVVGIVQAFDKLGASTATAGAGPSIMGSISEALVATAIGLLVAIPAVASFNAFQRVIKSKLANAEALTRTVLAHLEAERATPARASTPPSLTLVTTRNERTSHA